MRRALRLGLVWLLLLLCSGCVNTMLREREYVDTPLPEVRAAPPAPLGDRQEDWECIADLYLPSADASRLTVESRVVTIHSGQTKPEAFVEELLNVINQSGFWYGGQPLALAQVSNAVESTGELVTVNLHMSARMLSQKAFFALRVAITNTLVRIPDIKYVNILVEGRDIGLDTAETLPTGVMSAGYRGNDINTLWNQVETERSAEESQLQKFAALYYISEDGSALIGEVRSVTFPQRNGSVYAKSLIEELAKPPTTANARKVVPVSDWFERDPVHVREPETNTNYMELFFLSYLDDYLLPYGATRGMMFSSIAYTLMNFIPALRGVVIYVGGQIVTQMILMDESQWNDGAGMMRREHFTSLSSDVCTVYYPVADSDEIRPVKKPIAQRYRSQPRALFRLLMEIPDIKTGLRGAFPEGVSEADILGILVQGDTILVNFSEAFQKACVNNLSEEEERQMIYCMVNTLTEIDAIKRVRFYVEGVQKPLAGHLFISGEFWRHHGMIK